MKLVRGGCYLGVNEGKGREPEPRIQKTQTYTTILHQGPPNIYEYPFPPPTIAPLVLHIN